MTTIIGIRAEKEKEGIILASDLSQTFTSWQAQGDAYIKTQTKSEAQKIHVDNNGDFTIAMSGVADDMYNDFLYGLLSNKINVKRAIEAGFFLEVADLNAKRCEYKFPFPERLNGFLIATRFDSKPRLYDIYPLGKVEETPWCSIGSGSEFARVYISEQGLVMPPKIPPNVSLDEAIDLSVASLDRASRDIYTGGLDLVIVTADGIKAYGPQIKRNMDETRAKTINEIKALL
jgi:20S proteasome alpha/beta subunit